MSEQLSEAVVRIRQMILRGELAPGQRVAEAPLAEMLGMSRTPVRQALPLLAQEGLLVEHITRGYVVRAFTAADIGDAIDIRGAIEGLAALRVAETGASRNFLRELRACLEEGDALLAKHAADAADEAAYAEMNARFHALILSEARSPMLSEALDRVSGVSFAGPAALAIEEAEEGLYDKLYYAHRQHHGIVEALERGQSARVEALMREHANAAKDSLNLAELQIAAGAPLCLELAR